MKLQNMTNWGSWFRSITNNYGIIKWDNLREVIHNHKNLRSISSMKNILDSLKESSWKRKSLVTTKTAKRRLKSLKKRFRRPRSYKSASMVSHPLTDQTSVCLTTWTVPTSQRARKVWKKLYHNHRTNK